MRLAHNDYDWKSFGQCSEVARVSEEVALYTTERLNSGYRWSVELTGDEDAGPPIKAGYAPSVEEARQAAVDAWKNWAKKQAEDAGFIVT